MDYVDVFHVVDDAAFLDAFDEGVTGAVVGDCQTQSVFVLGNFDLFRPSFAYSISQWN